ncbi:MAG: hypothetical protein KAH01_07300, partial [Caldisericia bacterium]|nr:hypothetical protein [Caldisericia bacterium]
MACEIIDVEVKIKEIVKKTGMSKEIATELAHEFLAKETQKAQIDNMSGSIDIASEGNSGPIVPETAVQEPVINPVIEKNNSSLPDNMTSEKIIDPDEYFTLFNINKDEETEYSYDESDIEVLGRDYVRIKPEGWKFPVVFNMNTMKNKKGTWEVIATKNDLMSPPTKTVEVVVSEGNGWTESTVRDTGSKRYVKEFKDERYPNFDLLVQYNTETKLFSIIEVTTGMSLGAFASTRKVMHDQYKQKTTEGKITQEVLKEAVDKALEKQKKDAIPAQPLKILMSSIIMKNQTPDSLQKKIDTLTEPQLQRIKQILVSAIGKKTYQELSDWMDKAYNTGSKQSNAVAKTVLDKTFKFEGKPFKDIYDFAKRLPGILDKAYTGKVKDQRLDADNVVLNNMDWLTPELLLQIDMNKMQDGTTKTEILKHIENDKFETLEKSSPIDSFTLAKAMEFGRIFEGTFSGIPKEIFNKSLESITDLDDKLKFQKLYADDNPEPEYQHDTNMESILDNEEVFDRVLAKLQKLYPNITAKQIKSIQDTDGKKALGMALGMAIRYSSDAGIDTVPHEYAHIYINMLENTQYMDNVIKYIMKTKKINRADAKEFLAEKMGEDFSTREGGKKKDKYQNIIEKLWEYIRNVFKNVDPKDKKIMMDMINKVSENFHEGQNKESISLVPRDGFSRVDPETTFKTNKTGSEVLNKIQTVFPDSILTGSVALSSQGTVYRTGTGDLHDLDMIMPKGNYTEMKAKFLLEFEDATKIYDFYTKKKFINKIPVQKHIATYIVPPKNTVIADVRKHKGFYGKVEHYKIMEKTTNKIVGTYDAEIGYNNKGDSVILSEDFGSGEKAIIVDLMFQHDSLPARDNFLYHSKTLDRDVKMTTADSIFDAKKDIGDDSPRDKDIMDFNLFSKEKIIGDSEPVVTST